MTIADEISELKREKNAVILVHNYQPEEIQRLADFCGDSLELAKKAKASDADIIVICGVMFMAETAKILNPAKKVLLPAKDAGCPLADYVTPKIVTDARAKYPDAEVVLYVNSTAASKALADITCTSSNAIDVVKSLKSKRVLFGPDANLASWVAEHIPDKEIIPLPLDASGCCPIHSGMKSQTAKDAKSDGYSVVCHPECPKAIRDECDYVASTGGMIKLMDKADKWAILTERDMVSRLKSEFPSKTFRSYKDANCKDMKLITPEMILDTLKDDNNEKYEVILPESIVQKAGRAIERMLAL